jgi:hypothetical protein
MAARSPSQLLIVTIAVAVGLVGGLWLVGKRAADASADHERQGWADLSFEHLAAGELASHGFHLTGKEPASWSDISMRTCDDARGTINAVRCRIAPADVTRLFAFPAGSRRPANDRPPADWPWGDAADPARIPTWWRPSTGGAVQSRMYEDPRRGAGIFASYDGATSTLHFWTWQRAGWRPTRPSPLDHLVADELATAVARASRNLGRTPDAAGWIHVTGFAPQDCGLPAGRMPGGVTTIDALMLPVAGGHRYLLAVHGLDAAQAAALNGEYPLRELLPTLLPPTSKWPFALPASGLPTWFAPGPGQRGHHCLIQVGSGLVESGRWAAYDPATRTAFSWDWEGPTAQHSTADLALASP